MKQISSLEEASQVLTKDDLKNLSRKISTGKFSVPLDSAGNCFIEVRGTQISFFIVLQLIGNYEATCS